MLKLIYLAKRKPGFTHDQFVRRWRMHGARGMTQPMWRNVRGYAQAEAIRPEPVEGASTDHDGVAYMITRPDTFSSFTAEDMEAGKGMLADELETFSGPVPAVALWVTQDVLKPGDLGGYTAFLFFQDGDAARAAAQAWLAVPGVQRLILNLRSDAALGQQANTLPYAAVVEISVPTLAGLQDTIAARGADALAQADVAMVTREALLWDRMTLVEEG